MLNQLHQEYPDFLKKEYYIEGIALVMFPQVVAVVFISIVFIVLFIVLMENRRWRNRFRFEEEGNGIVEEN